MDERHAKLEALKKRREKLVQRFCIFCLAELAIMVLTAPFPVLTTLSMVIFALLLLALLPMIIVNEMMKSKIKKLEASLPPEPAIPPVPTPPPMPDEFHSVTLDDERPVFPVERQPVILDPCIGTPMQNLLRSHFGLRFGDSLAADFERMGLTVGELEKPHVLPDRLKYDTEHGYYLAGEDHDFDRGFEVVCLTRHEQVFRRWLLEYVADSVVFQMDTDQKTRCERAINMVCKVYPPEQCADFIRRQTRRINGDGPILPHRHYLFDRETMTFKENYGTNPSHIQHARTERWRLRRETFLPLLESGPEALRQLFSLAAQELIRDGVCPDWAELPTGEQLRHIHQYGDSGLVQDHFCNSWPVWDPTDDFHRNEIPNFYHLTEPKRIACALITRWLFDEQSCIRIDPSQTSAVLPVLEVLRQLHEPKVRLLCLAGVTEDTRYYTDLVFGSVLRETFYPDGDGTARYLVPGEQTVLTRVRTASVGKIHWQLGEVKYAAELRRVGTEFHLYFSGPKLGHRGRILTPSQIENRDVFLRLLAAQADPYAAEALFLPLWYHVEKQKHP